MPPWLEIAKSYIGLQEIRGPAHNPTILGWLQRFAKNIGRWGKSRDETAWCAVFVSHCLEAAGEKGTDHALASSYMTWGKPSKLRQGAVVVIQRKRGPNVTGSGRGGYHVGFLWRWEKNWIRVLGGNQRNRVGINGYSKKNYEIVAIRWPGSDAA